MVLTIQVLISKIKGKTRACGCAAVIMREDLRFGGFSSAGKFELVFIDCTMEYNKYRATLSTTLLRLIENHHSRGARIQDSNTLKPICAFSSQYFYDSGIDDIDSPPHSSGMNPIENL